MTENTSTAKSVDWDDDSIKTTPRGSSRDLEKFFLDDNETARIVVLDQTAFLAMTHYEKNVKRYVRCIRDITGGECPGCEKTGEPRQRFGANVVQYKTTKTGEIVKPYEWSVKLWTFGPDKFTQLRAVKEEWGDLRKVDLKVLCKSKQFQELVITPLKNSIWLDPEAGIREQVAASYNEGKYDVEKIIGKIYTVEDMKKVLAGQDLDRPSDNAPPPEVIAQAVTEIEQALQESDSQSGSPAESVDFDALLEDLA